MITHNGVHGASLYQNITILFLDDQVCSPLSAIVIQTFFLYQSWFTDETPLCIVIC